MLSDLSWIPKPSYLILIGDADDILSLEPDQALQGFLELLTDIGEEWSNPVEGSDGWDRPCVPFHAVLEVNSRKPVGRLDRLPVAVSRPS
ncbi:barstar family protein [Rhizobium sp. Root1203]|uniref:barstar family protein n=1 Tax=Rhizobium sp. Root1203 TaxID=1736427 RepID=UPI0009EAF67D